MAASQWVITFTWHPRQRAHCKYAQHIDAPSPGHAPHPPIAPESWQRWTSVWLRRPCGSCALGGLTGHAILSLISTHVQTVHEYRSGSHANTQGWGGQIHCAHGRRAALPVSQHLKCRHRQERSINSPEDQAFVAALVAEVTHWLKVLRRPAAGAGSTRLASPCSACPCRHASTSLLMGPLLMGAG